MRLIRRRRLGPGAAGADGAAFGAAAALGVMPGILREASRRKFGHENKVSNHVEGPSGHNAWPEMPS